MPQGLGPRDQGSSARRPVPHLLLQLVHMLPVPLGASDAMGNGWSGSGLTVTIM